MSDYRGSVHAFICRTGGALRASGEGRKLAYRRNLIRHQAREIDDLWDRLSRAYALIRQESPPEIIQDEMEQLRAMLDNRQQLKTSG